MIEGHADKIKSEQQKKRSPIHLGEVSFFGQINP
jgi:hypothetical protein